LARLTPGKELRLERRYQAMGVNTDAAAAAVHANGHGRNAMVGAMLGTIFEWYDFFLFALLAIYFAASFSHREMKWPASSSRWRHSAQDSLSARWAHSCSDRSEIG